jgi:hypothetical protein
MVFEETPLRWFVASCVCCGAFATAKWTHQRSKILITPQYLQATGSHHCGLPTLSKAILALPI